MEGNKVRGRSWIRDMISQFILLVLFGVGVYALYRKAQSVPEISAITWIGTLFKVSLLILVIMGVLFIFQLFSSGWLERFDPGDPKSVRRLDRIRRFRLSSRFVHLQETWPTWRKDIRQAFEEKGWTMRAREPFDALGLRLRWTPFRRERYDRVFLYYHPMLNVIVVDQVLKSCERLIFDNEKTQPTRRNLVILMTDMTNRDEVTSAGAGTVNYLGKLDGRTSLYPMLIDFNAGRFFYPLDSTLMRITHRFWYRIKRHQLLNYIREQVPTTDESLSDSPDAFEESTDFFTRKKTPETDEVSSDHFNDPNA